MHQIGRQILAEMTYCSRDRLDDLGHLKEMMVQAARLAGATVLGVEVHRFEPHGVSAVVLIEESHLTIHTWPELGYAAVDVFTCGDHVVPEQAVQAITEGLAAGNVTSLSINRGVNLNGFLQAPPQGATVWQPPRV